MNFKVTVNKPINEVFTFYTAKSTIQKWQEQLIAVEHVSGKVGEINAKTKLTYKTVVVFETINTSNQPNKFSAT